MGIWVRKQLAPSTTNGWSGKWPFPSKVMRKTFLYENDFYLHETKKSFWYQCLRTEPRLKQKLWATRKWLINFSETIGICLDQYYIDLSRAKSEALDNIFRLFKQNIKSCDAKRRRQRERWKHNNRWFSRYVIAAMLVDGKQKIAH